jgi:exopolysaccharide biosynthesis polyprenyl glycosylphosphotransferase
VSASLALEELYDALDERTLQILTRRSEEGRTQGRGSLMHRVLLGADLLGLSVAFLAAQVIYAANMRDAGALNRLGEFAVFALSLPLWIVAANIYGLYDRDEERADHSTADDFSGIFHLATVGTFALYSLSRLSGAFSPEFGKLFIFWLLAISATVTARSLARTYCRRQIEYLQNTIIVGAGDVGQRIARKLINHPEYGLNLVGMVDSQPKERLPGLGHVTLLGDLANLSDLVSLLDVERVIFAFSNDSYETLVASIDDLRRQDVQIDIIPRLFDSLGPSVSLHTLEGVPLVSLPPTRLPRSSLVIKRVVDIIVSGIGLLLLAPVLLLVAVLIKADSRGPILYRHERVGQNRRQVRLFKFRTMYLEACRGTDYGGEDAENAFALLMAVPERQKEFAASYKFRDDPRVTRFGRFLRRTSIDELPQLLNVFVGDISLVGPRALTEEEIDTYYEGSSHDLTGIKPGVTGYWQINGRSQLEYEDRVRLDMAYVGGWSLGLDLTILAKTLRVVFSRRSAF